MYLALLDNVQEREPEYEKWTYEEQQRAFGVADTGRYQPIYEPIHQAENAAQHGKPSGLVSRIVATFFYHHADSPDGGGLPYSVGPTLIGHYAISPEGSWIWSPRGAMDTQNPNRIPIARRLPSSWSANVPEYGQEE